MKLSGSDKLFALFVVAWALDVAISMWPLKTWIPTAIRDVYEVTLIFASILMLLLLVRNKE